MRTPDISQVPAFRNKAAQLECGENFERRGRRNPKLRRKLTANLRQHVSRLSRRQEPIASDQQMLELVLRLTEGIPFQEDGEHPMWREMNDFNVTLHTRGPTPDVCSHMKNRMAAIYLNFLLHRPETADEAFRYILCLKTLVKIGANTRAGVPKLKQCAWEVVKFYRYRREYKELSRAVIVYANNHRLDNQDSGGNHFYISPFQIMVQYQGKHDLEYWLSLHSSVSFNLRFFGQNWPREKQQAAIRLLTVLARDLKSPAITLETYKALAGHYNSLSEYDHALEYCDQIRELLTEHSCSPHERLAALRPEIHALLGSKKRVHIDEGIHIVQTEFIDTYRQAPHFYYSPLLNEWKVKYDLSFDIPPGRYGSAIVTSLPRS